MATTTSGTPTENPSDDNQAVRDDLWRTLHVVSEWIRVADAKAGATVAVDGVLLALFGGRLRALADPPLFTIIALSTATAVATVSGLLAIWAVQPRARRLGADSIIHYGSIAKFESFGSYRDAAVETMGDPDGFAEALTRHIWVLSRSATRKYVLVERAITLLFIAGVVGAPALLPW
jgi:hypothetical protein